MSHSNRDSAAQMSQTPPNPHVCHFLWSLYFILDQKIPTLSPFKNIENTPSYPSDSCVLDAANLRKRGKTHGNLVHLIGLQGSEWS